MVAIFRNIGGDNRQKKRGICDVNTVFKFNTPSGKILLVANPFLALASASSQLRRDREQESNISGNGNVLLERMDVCSLTKYHVLFIPICLPYSLIPY